MGPTRGYPAVLNIGDRTDGNEAKSAFRACSWDAQNGKCGSWNTHRRRAMMPPSYLVLSHFLTSGMREYPSFLLFSSLSVTYESSTFSPFWQKRQQPALNQGVTVPGCPSCPGLIFLSRGGKQWLFLFRVYEGLSLFKGLFRFIPDRFMLNTDVHRYSPFCTTPGLYRG